MPVRSSELRFTVDAALFRELGERLVGKPHIALAELIKNSYDADATEVRVRFAKDRIEVSDNGNGMKLGEFKHFWMRVGSPHKQTERLSPRFHRPMTGSKGVGRLAVQFLASQLELRTRSLSRGAKEIRASVDWTQAVKAGDLTRATAQYVESSAASEYPGGASHGTTIVLAGLQHRWTNEELVALARETWWLQPPFHVNPNLKVDAAHAFRVELEHAADGAAREFDEQIRAVLDLWHARITGKLTRPKGRDNGAGTVDVTLDFEDGEHCSTSFDIPSCAVSACDFEVRIFSLSRRQGRGIKVDQAREYFKQFGGVHVYDAGFHLPYYGPDTDWLRIEIDHSHRLSKSSLLPPELQVANGLNNLPTQSRIFGVVHVDTAAEQDAGHVVHRRDYLKIQVSRDRLVDNRAFEQLRDAVRWALDYYAMQETRRKLRKVESERSTEPATRKVSRIERVLQENRDRMPKRVFEALRAGVSEVGTASATEMRAVERRMGLLGALATAGMAALAYEHEIEDQFRMLGEITSRLEEISSAASRFDRDGVTSIVRELQSWLRRARGTRELFSHLASEESRDVEARYRARTFISDVRHQMEPLLRGADVNVDGVAASTKLPLGTYAEWSGVFQNVLMNAATAVRECARKDIMVVSRATGKVHEILVQDSGVGVDLADAARLFEPFERVLANAPRSSRPVVGQGLGLSIVRMIAEIRGCRVAFVPPDDGFNAAFQLAWTEA